MARKGGDTKRNGEEGSAIQKAPATGAEDPRSAQETVEYIAAMLDGLKVLAHQARLPFLAYLLTMALDEANAEKAKRN